MMQPKTGAKHPKSTTFCGPPQGCGLEERSAMPMEVWTGAYRLPRRKGSRVFGVTFRHGSSVTRKFRDEGQGAEIEVPGIEVPGIEVP